MTAKKVKDIISETAHATKVAVAKPLIDLLLGKTMSRKLQVLVLATWLVYIDKITGDAWMFIALLYVLGILWLNHVQAMAELGKNMIGNGCDNHKFGNPEPLPDSENGTQGENYN